MTKKCTSLFNDATTKDGLPAAQKRRKWSEGKVLSAEAEAWFIGLPEAVRPLQLSESFPCVCNRLAECWSCPESVLPFLDDLLTDKRGGRQGFPLPIIMEITKLKEHFLQSYAPHKLDIWSNTTDLY